MYNYQDDTFVVQKILNNMKNMPSLDLGREGFNMVPNFELRWTGDGDPRFKEVIKGEKLTGSVTLDVNVEKLNSYIEFITQIRVKGSNLTKSEFFINIPMVNCKEEWFKGLKTPVNDIERRLCPDLDKIAKLKPEFWQLKG